MQSVDGVADLYLERLFPILVRRIANLNLGIIGTPERLATMACIISKKQSPISVTALAREQEVRPATMSRMLTGLFDDGMIKRHEDETDGRGCLVTATPEGLLATKKAQRIYRKNITRLVSFTAAGVPLDANG